MGLSRFSHIIFALGYGAAGGMAVLLVHVFRPQGDPLVPWLTGMVIILSGGLIHEVVARISAGRSERGRAVRRQEHYQELAELVLKTRAEIRKMSAAMGTAAPKTPVPHAESPTSLAQPQPQPQPGPAPAPVRSPPPPVSPPPAASHAPPSKGDHEPPPAFLSDALTQERIEVHIQPVVSLPSRRHRFFEVFTRIRQLDGGLMLPDQYLPAARRYRLIGAIDNILVTRTLNMIHETEVRNHEVGFFCNVAGESLCESAILRLLLDRCSSHPSIRNKLVLELSLAEVSPPSPSLLPILEALRGAGFHFSLGQIDTLALDTEALEKLGVRFLKVPAAMLLSQARQTEAVSLHQRFIVVAEKVGSAEVATAITALGIPFAQGYLFSPVRPAAPPRAA